MGNRGYGCAMPMEGRMPMQGRQYMEPGMMNEPAQQPQMDQSVQSQPQGTTTSTQLVPSDTSN